MPRFWALLLLLSVTALAQNQSTPTYESRADREAFVRALITRFGSSKTLHGKTPEGAACHVHVTTYTQAAPDPRYYDPKTGLSHDPKERKSLLQRMLFGNHYYTAYGAAPESYKIGIRVQREHHFKNSHWLDEGWITLSSQMDPARETRLNENWVIGRNEIDGKEGHRARFHMRLEERSRANPEVWTKRNLRGAFVGGALNWVEVARKDSLVILKSRPQIRNWQNEIRCTGLKP